ncbi:hypothetical protein CICLE_v10009425mg [Citrus x clementina]|uniref:Peptidylprolyl isomerase n=1 Tax=Citrus clementina TaxID=85681 RepID=V4UNP3_CITCL|nr:hypothetical protein CICLE_v10009425mg [Citrus x clementina]
MGKFQLCVSPVMGTLAIQASLLFPCASKSSSIKGGRPNGGVSQNLFAKFSSLTVKRLPRRTLLQFIGFSSMVLHVNPDFDAPMPDMKEPEAIRTLKLASGVRIQEIIEGEGPEASEGDIVQLNYVCRRSNGYFVHR